MTKANRRRNIIIVIVALLIIALMLLTRCLPIKRTVPSPADSGQASTPVASTQATMPATTEPAEVLSPAMISAPQQVNAGAAFSVMWTGPDNRGDYVTIVAPDAGAQTYTSYEETQRGPSLELIAPIEPGTYEVRYVTGRSHTVLARAAVEVTSVSATIDAADEVVLGSTFPVAWTGPNNAGDYVTIVPKDAPDEQYGSYIDADKGSPQSLTAPTMAGLAELRYVTGQGKKVLARRPIRIAMAEVTLSAPTEAIAGTTIQVTWSGPNNAGDYITVVSASTPDGRYGNYTNTASGSPLNLLIPIIAGEAELRYMTGQGSRVLARRSIRVVEAKITLRAPSQGQVGAAITVEWTGPDNPGDYITVVAKGDPDDRYGSYANTTEGSPLSINLPREGGDAEIRYVSGQGRKVLARFVITVLP